jgi:hypothetical protein
MKNKIFIHIGMQKTGSTWLQTIVFPKIVSHDVVYKETFRELISKLSEKDKIISYENYVGYPHLLKIRGLNGWLETRKKSFSNLSELFPNADIILVVRKQSELIRSLYNQYIKVGGNITFYDYWMGNNNPYAIERNALMYRDLICDIKKYFSGRILIMNFDLFKNNKIRFFEVLSEFVGGLNPVDLKSDEVKIVNRSLPPNQIRALLFSY